MAGYTTLRRGLETDLSGNFMDTIGGEEKRRRWLSLITFAGQKCTGSCGRKRRPRNKNREKRWGGKYVKKCGKGKNSIPTST